jgi:hypothetical protein
MNPSRLKRLRALTTKQLLHELVEDLIDAATDLGGGQANPLTDTKPLEHNLNQAAEKLYNALDALADEAEA